MSREVNNYHGRTKILQPTGEAPQIIKTETREKAADPYGVLADFYAKKKAKAEAEAAAAAELLAKKRAYYKETGELLTPERAADMPVPSSAKPKGKRGKGRRQSKPGTLWVMMANGQIRAKEFKSTKEASEAAEKASSSPKCVWARAFNDTTGKIYIGRGWVHDPMPGQKVNNMPVKFWAQLTKPERHKIKETEIPKYKKPGWECKDMSVKEARWQSVGESRRGKTYDRRNNAQGIPYKHRSDFGSFPFKEG